jgi:hypothetical protein
VGQWSNPANLTDDNTESSSVPTNSNDYEGASALPYPPHTNKSQEDFDNYEGDNDNDSGSHHTDMQSRSYKSETFSDIRGIYSFQRNKNKIPSDKEGLLSDNTSRPIVVFKERWIEKENRLKTLSMVGHLPGYRLLPVIVKSNDDLRQEQIASQVIFQIYQILREGKAEFWCRPYTIVAMTPDSGVIEAIPDTVSLDALRRRVHRYTSLKDFFVRFYGGVRTEEFYDARRNFIISLATYCIICYILNLKDRHNGNILLDRLGHVMHIDFGFILGISPGGNIGFESAPFKLTKEFVELMDGPRSLSFVKFR